MRGTADVRAMIRASAVKYDRLCLVYDDTYDWQPSETRELPEDDLSPGPGEWVVMDAEGDVIERFANFDGTDASRASPLMAPRCALMALMSGRFIPNLGRSQAASGAHTESRPDDTRCRCRGCATQMDY